jgi:hypothetical protein
MYKIYKKNIINAVYSNHISNAGHPYGSIADAMKVTIMGRMEESI